MRDIRKYMASSVIIVGFKKIIEFIRALSVFIIIWAPLYILVYNVYSITCYIVQLDKLSEKRSVDLLNLRLTILP
jgi:hypothetical protein